MKAIRRSDSGGDEAPPDPGADELIAALGAADDQPLDIDWTDQALETDSFSDVGSAGGGSDEGFDFDRVEAGDASLSEHLAGAIAWAWRARGRAGAGDS